MFVPEEAGWRYCPAQPRRLVMGSSTMKPRVKTPPAFKTCRDVERYFGGKTIECLLCGQRFRRGGHLAAKHEMSVDEYRTRFGLPWSRGLTSAPVEPGLLRRSCGADQAQHESRYDCSVHRFNSLGGAGTFLPWPFGATVDLA